MKGRRLEIVMVDGKPDLNACTPTEPGDYVGPLVGYTADKPAVFYLLPNQQPGDFLRHVTQPPHVFQEEEDGTLTIQGSILHRGGSEWHGYLTKGEWSEA